MLVTLVGAPGSVLALWFGLDAYARAQWRAEMKRLASAGQPVDISTFMREHPEPRPSIIQSQAGAVFAVFSPRLVAALDQRDLFRDNPRLHVAGQLIQYRGLHRHTFHELFGRFPTRALARALREGAFDSGDAADPGAAADDPSSPFNLPRLAGLPLTFHELRWRAVWETRLHICRLAEATEEHLRKESQKEYWDRIRSEVPGAHFLILYGPKAMECLLMIQLIRDAERRRDMLLALDEKHPRVPIAKPLPRPALRMDYVTVRGVSMEVDLAAGAIITNMQRVIIAFAQYRAAHGANPADMDALLASAPDAKARLIEVDGARMEYALDDKTGRATLSYHLSPELFNIANATEQILSDNWNEKTPMDKISVILFDPRDAPKLKAKD